MNWYYVREGQRAGPVSDSEFHALVGSGEINSETLVWRQGMAQWQRYREVQSPGAAIALAQQRCVECGNVFSEDDMVRYGDSFVCAACKPVFFQRIKEGAPLQTGMVYGGFWIRFVAKFVDGIILGVVNSVLQYGFMFLIIGADPEAGPGPGAITGMTLVMMLLQWGVNFGYNTFFIGKFAATPGKMACGLKVVTSDGGSVSYLRAFARSVSEILSSLILMIGYIMAAFDEEKRTLHDRICDTRVIRK